jgi:lipopolysaccharide biosynthesis protein
MNHSAVGLTSDDRMIRAETATQVSALAFYLPQFHPIPENDRWWGRGFTEWTNVVKARPRFPGHCQPHLPADLGFYDLRLTESRRAQGELARKYGINGFCYYHYWFSGKRLLEQPLERMLEDGQPDIPFCLCWANESWSRRWDGTDAEVLMQQTYSREDDFLHFQTLLRFFRDKRYIRIDGRPLFLVYRASQLPSPLETTDRWRREAEREGLKGLYLCCVESHNERADPRSIGFDASVFFAPRWSILGPRVWRLQPWQRRRLGTMLSGLKENQIHEYGVVVEKAIQEQRPSFPRFPGVCVGFDNSARRKAGATILVNATPESYGKWLTAACNEARRKSDCPPFVFINAWNEWAEGNHLEPCQRWGRGYLEATQRALMTAREYEASCAPS